MDCPGPGTPWIFTRLKWNFHALFIWKSKVLYHIYPTPLNFGPLKFCLALILIHLLNLVHPSQNRFIRVLYLWRKFSIKFAPFNFRPHTPVLKFKWDQNLRKLEGVQERSTLNELFYYAHFIYFSYNCVPGTTARSTQKTSGTCVGSNSATHVKKTCQCKLWLPTRPCATQETGLADWEVIIPRYFQQFPMSNFFNSNFFKRHFLAGFMR